MKHVLGHGGESLRSDLAQIARWVAPHARVLDLGCGDGTLLHWLAVQQSCETLGVEIADENVLACIKRGVNVIQADIDRGLAMFARGRFDVVVLSQALQATRETERVLREIGEIGRECLVSIPNFGHWSHVTSLLSGHMPVNKRLPYAWYDTPNFHFATAQDFEELLTRLGFDILDRAFLDDDRPIKFMPNLRSTLAVYRFQKRSL
ncbi:MAG: methionine biosynthesis protein MetW [Betaproteobacteria bacterium]|jgi:methionine biosynthesis protein MetW|nr:methionine biosynthesis protein MetW [Betaproteobacteria bacterium]